MTRASRHGVVMVVSRGIQGTLPKDSLLRLAPGGAMVPGELTRMAAKFSPAQDKCHLAAYDRSARFRRQDVLKLIADIESAM